MGLVSQCRRCHLVGSLVAQACSALKVASCLNNLVIGSSALKKFDQSLRFGMPKVPVQTLHCANCFGLQCRLELYKAPSDPFLLSDSKSIVPKLSWVWGVDGSCNGGCKARLVILKVRGASAISRFRASKGQCKCCPSHCFASAACMETLLERMPVGFFTSFHSPS